MPDFHWCCPLTMHSADPVRISSGQRNVGPLLAKNIPTLSLLWITSSPSQKNISIALKGRGLETNKFKAWEYCNKFWRHCKSYSSSIHGSSYTSAASSAAKHFLAHHRCRSSHTLLLLTFLFFVWKRNVPVITSSVCKSADLKLKGYIQTRRSILNWALL